ncbi:MAG: type II secretion system F family protein [Myxococcales bacterium]|nr:type II secretion system F family protein [Myxococcales bacterium]MDD9969030.1 type II secretion system F family protein [Myxococcales bacterium]
MAEWVWEARTRAGELRKGTMDADDKESVNSKLRAQNLSPLKVKKKGKKISLSFGSPVTDQEIVVFIRQFATMIDAGLPLVQCLEILSSQGENKAFNAILKDIKDGVEQGATFSDSLARHPKVFDSLFVNLVAAGEMGGILDTILNRLGVYIEKRVKLQRQVKSAMTYPASVFVIAIVVMGIMLTQVVPTFEAMFEDFGGADALPPLTKFVIGVSHAAVDKLPLALATAGTLFFLVAYTYRLEKGKRFYHWLQLHVPVLGPAMRKIAVARFTRTMGTLLSSGVPILDALNIVAKSAGNVLVSNALEQVAERITEGRSMSEPLAETKVFPSMVVQMIGVGEQTGALDQMLNKIADFYEEEVDVAVAGLTSLLEPIMMVGIGGMVGFILVAMYMPIFDIAGAVNAH